MWFLAVSSMNKVALSRPRPEINGLYTASSFSMASSEISFSAQPPRI